MTFRHWGRAAVLTAATAGGLACAAPAHAPHLAVLDQIELGQWQLRDSGAAGPMRSVCVADAAMLLQLAHPRSGCQQLVLSDSPGSATVHYTCPGVGHGRTTVSVETPRLLRVQTQGVSGGAPFDFDYEGRRVGACGPVAAR